MTRIPVTLLTGFLGSGKTTLLNRLLRDPALRQSMVLVNEFGSVPLDHQLLGAGSEAMQVLAGGCLCCSFQSGLADSLKQIFLRRVRGEIDFTRVVIETSGLADPFPLLRNLVADAMVRAQYQLCGVITCVDVRHIEQQWVHPEAQRQLLAADLLVLTHTLPQQSTPALLGDRRALDGAAITAADVVSLSHRVSRYTPCASHTSGLVSAAAHAAEVDGMALLQRLPQVAGDWLRGKGLLNDGGAGPLLVEVVYGQIEPARRLPQWPDADRQSRMVAISHTVSAAVLQQQLAGLLATDTVRNHHGH